MKRNLTFLASALSTATYKKIWREALESLQESLWSSVLLRQNFTTLGAAQFMRDVQAILALVDRNIPEGSAAMAQLEEGVRLLSLPVVSDGNDESNEDNGGGAGGDRDEGNSSSNPFSLKQISDRMFTDNTEARRALEDLGIQSLEPANARRILQRRVENSE